MQRKRGTGKARDKKTDRQTEKHKDCEAEEEREETEKHLKVVGQRKETNRKRKR